MAQGHTTHSRTPELPPSSTGDIQKLQEGKNLLTQADRKEVSEILNPQTSPDL